MEMKFKVAIAAIALLVGASIPAISAEKGTKDEAKAMVAKAVTYIKEVGPEKAYADFSVKGGKFSHLDIYVVVYGLDGKVLAHGSKAKLIGKMLMEAQDVDGVYYVKDRVHLAKTKGTFWQDYKFVNPVTKKIAPKQMYCERVGETAVCAGVYK
jgi:signal transduction histidine kinase